MDSRETVIECKDLEFWYAGSERPVLSGLSFELKKGEALLVYGKTGSGKTTLLKLLAGLTFKNTKGRVKGSLKVLGTTPTDPLKLFPRVAMMLQDPLSHLVAETVYEEVAFALENLGLPEEEIRKRVKEALSLVELDWAEDRSLEELSGGQRQRVSLASVLALKPEVLLLDEPLAQLDPRIAEKVVTLLETLKNFGTTIVISEHRLPLIKDLVDKVLRLDETPEFYPDREEFLKKSLRWYGKKKGPSKRASSKEPVIKVESLGFSYGNKVVLKDVSLTFRKGEVVALLGENGSGKTTFLHILAGILRPTSGRVYLEKGCRVGILLQNPDLMLTRNDVFSELAFVLENERRNKAEIESKVKKVSELLNISSFLSKHPLSLSRGQRLRVALGSVLTFDPDVLLLDEPTTAQDPENAQRIINSLNASLVIFSTHDLDVAKTLANRLLIFENNTVKEHPTWFH